METDNEFDKMFRSKLIGYEAEPSADVWPGIEDGLNVRKRKITIVPLLGIAASLLILISAGLLFIPHQTKTGGRHIVKNIVSRVNKPSNKPEMVKNIEKHVIKPETGKTIPAQTIAVNRVKQLHLIKYRVIKDTHTELKPANGPLAASIQPDKQQVINPAAIVREVPGAVEQPVNEKINDKPVLAAVSLPATDQPVAEAVKTKHKIKSFGDLVNVVIAKVDKRKDKLIEFTDNDDEESTITGINLGILKIKKEK